MQPAGMHATSATCNLGAAKVNSMACHQDADQQFLGLAWHCHNRIEKNTIVRQECFCYLMGCYRPGIRPPSTEARSRQGRHVDARVPPGDQRRDYLAGQRRQG